MKYFIYAIGVLILIFGLSIAWVFFGNHQYSFGKEKSIIKMSEWWSFNITGAQYVDDWQVENTFDPIRYFIVKNEKPILEQINNIPNSTIQENKDLIEFQKESDLQYLAKPNTDYRKIKFIKSIVYLKNDSIITIFISSDILVFVAFCN